MLLSHRSPDFAAQVAAQVAARPADLVRPQDALRVQLDHLEYRLAHNQKLPTATLQRLRDALETVPCSTAEYSRALNHLLHAAHYYHSGECGAARYELLMLLRRLRPLAQAS